MNSTWALVLAGMVVVTYGIRLSFLVFGHRLTFPRWEKSPAIPATTPPRCCFPCRAPHNER